MSERITRLNNLAKALRTSAALNAAAVEKKAAKQAEIAANSHLAPPKKGGPRRAGYGRVSKIRLDESGDELGRRRNAADVEKWFRVAHSRLNGFETVCSAWTVKQQVLANRMLEEYGDDLTNRGIVWFFEHWDELVRSSRGTMTVPSIHLLWSMRDRVFIPVQRQQHGKYQQRTNIDPSTEPNRQPQRHPKNSDEFRPLPTGSVVGWGD